VNLKEAQRILENPKFGDADCIAAVKFMEREAEADDLRRKLNGKTTKCWCCEGSGEIDCKAMCVHECPTCYGMKDLTLTPSILKDLYLEQLRDLYAEQAVTA